jgi:tripartite-type tricarboxylate transporter receptor subunit TctC
MNRRTLLAAGAAALAAPRAMAQDWAARGPVRIVIPFAPGGVPDIVARLVQPAMTTSLGQPVVIDNRPGAGGALAAEHVAGSAPDGQTLFMSTVSSQAVIPALTPNLRYDPVRGFTPIGLAAVVPLVMLVRADGAIRDMAGLANALKAEAGRHNFASSGVGSILHLGAELFLMKAGARAEHIPLRGSAQALAELIAGRVTFVFDALPPAMALIRDGKLRALAVGTPARSKALPEVPTMAEAGFAGVEAYTWAALYGPGGLPAAAVARLNSVLNAALAEPATAARMDELGYESRRGTPEALARHTAEEQAKWAEVVRAAGVRLEG